MEETNGKRDLGYYSLEIVKDKAGNPLIIVKFRSEGKKYLVRKLSWCPTSAEIEFLYRTMKWMEKSTVKTQTSEIQGFHSTGDTVQRFNEEKTETDNQQT